MRNLANLLLVACLLSSPAFAFAQNDPFGADPFAGGKPKPPAVKKPNTRQVAQPKAVAATANVKAKSIPARGSYEATLRIRAALGDETSQSFVELRLAEAVRQISEAHDIPIVINNRALEEIGLSAQEPVSITLKNVSLRSFLRLMLRELDLTYMIKDEVLEITTVEAAEQNLVVEMYKFSEQLTEKADVIVKAMTSSVVAGAWDVRGGPCSVTAIDNVLIVFATETIHEDVIDFLHKLQQAFENQKAKN